ncbi:MAG: hypothetical protein IPN71_02655 [Fibrobacteres bacterium]|nr:hypothetical protein [Fibrobacterota bacterium]
MDLLPLRHGPGFLAGTGIAHVVREQGKGVNMMWMLLGLGSALSAGASVELPKDSTESIEFSRHLPQDLRERVLKARTEMRVRHDSLAQLSLPERARWLDSLRNQAKVQRTQSLERLTPQERARVEERLRELERKVQLRKQGTSNPGYRQ